MRRFRPQHVRVRLTLLYVAILASALVLYAICTSGLLLWHMRLQLDRYAVQDLETIEGLLEVGPGGQLSLREDYHNHPESRHIQERLLEVLAPDGRILYRNERLGVRELGGPPFAGEGEGGYSERLAKLSDGTRVRLVSRRHILQGRPILIRLAYSEELAWLHFAELLGALLLGLPIALGVAGFAGYGLARRALEPIEQMARRAGQITPERLHERLPVENPDDELGQLALVFNSMLTRLDQSFEQLKRFTSDASHELRTPLTAIRSVGEVGLQKDGSREEYRDVIGSMLEEANLLTRLVDNLLTIARADAGQIQLQRATVPVLALAQQSAALIDVLVEEKAQRLMVDGDPSVTIEGDPLLLRQALVNILHNAVKYSPVGGVIHLLVRQSPNHDVLIDVTDSGSGISSSDAERVFDRFYRVDQSRSREAGGTGLGLPIAKWTVEAHGGSISLLSERHEGCTFRLQFPANAPERTVSEQGKNRREQLV